MLVKGDWMQEVSLANIIIKVFLANENSVSNPEPFEFFILLNN